MAFAFCIKARIITIGSSVTGIGDGVFLRCDNLKIINVDKNNKVYEDINGILFSKNPASIIYYPVALDDTTYSIPKGTVNIGKLAFNECALTSITIPDSVTGIGNEAFYFCNNITSITIPSSVTSIGERAFFSCDNLTAINVDKNNTVYADINGVLFNKNYTSIIYYPEALSDTAYSIPNTVINIKNHVFADCKNLTSITIPNSVITIDDSAFSGCFNLTSITIPNSVKIIGNKAFEVCTNLKSITIPDSVVSIGSWAFSYCRELTSIKMYRKTEEGFGAFFESPVNPAYTD
jgi:hypothetical protein